MKQTTKRLRHTELANAICELRRRLNWSQTELARAIDKRLGHAKGATGFRVISDWERSIKSPNPDNRSALAQLALKQEWEDLAAIFTAGRESWDFLAAIDGVRSKKEAAAALPQERPPAA